MKLETIGLHISYPFRFFMRKLDDRVRVMLSEGTILPQ
jgi:small nuclear ribonucleoprotein (snRNP)-like protein